MQYSLQLPQEQGAQGYAIPPGNQLVFQFPLSNTHTHTWHRLEFLALTKTKRDPLLLLLLLPQKGTKKIPKQMAKLPERERKSLYSLEICLEAGNLKNNNNNKLPVVTSLGQFLLPQLKRRN